jgi:hypothetical protein
MVLSSKAGSTDSKAGSTDSKNGSTDLKLILELILLIL